jgi:hypothetical protein
MFTIKRFDDNYWGYQDDLLDRRNQLFIITKSWSWKLWKDATDLNWYEANGHNIAIRLCEIVSFVPGSCFVLVILPRLRFIAPYGAAFAGLA